jgi:hypothetical protein
MEALFQELEVGKVFVFGRKISGNQVVSTKSKPAIIRVLVFPGCNEPGLEIVRSLVDQSDIEAHGVYKIMEVNAGPGGAIGIFRYAGVNVPLRAFKFFAGQPITILRHAEALGAIDRPSQTILITHDLAEQLQLNELMPTVRVVSTEMLETLGQEKM